MIYTHVLNKGGLGVRSPFGEYKEVVTVSLPDRRRPVLGSKRTEVMRGGPVTIESSPVCCVCDIPAPHLRYHAYRYGRFAVGFHREAISGAGFNPVFYTLTDTPVVRSIYRGLSSLDAADYSRFEDIADSLGWELDEVANRPEIDGGLDDIREEANSLEDLTTSAVARLKSLLAFIKTFGPTELVRSTVSGSGAQLLSSDSRPIRLP